jgi:hypothetical protein
VQDPPGCLHLASDDVLLSIDPLILRDRLVAEACAHFSRSEISEGIATLTKLQFVTIDEETLAKTDPFLPTIAGGKKSFPHATLNVCPPMTKW